MSAKDGARYVTWAHVLANPHAHVDALVTMGVLERQDGLGRYYTVKQPHEHVWGPPTVSPVHGTNVTLTWYCGCGALQHREVWPK